MVTASSANLAPSLMPLVRYRDVPAAIDWLADTLGFEPGEVVTGNDGRILYAQLSLGTARIMLEPAMDGADEAAAKGHSAYIVIPDADAHYAKTCAAGAEIEFVIHDFGQGGRGYSCRDCEGHIWSFGTYDPWRHGTEAKPEPLPLAPSPRKALRWAIVSGLAASIVTSTVAATFIGGKEPPAATSAALERDQVAAPGDGLVQAAEAQLSAERAARLAVEGTVEKIRTDLEEERQARKAADHTAENLQALMAQRALATAALPEELARERRAREVAERARGEVQARLDREQTAAVAARQELSSLTEKLRREQEARKAADLAQTDANSALAREREAAGAVADELTDIKEQLASERNARKTDRQALAAAVDETARARAEKEQAANAAAQLRRQLARAQAATAATGDTEMAEPPAPAGPPKSSPAAKSAEPQYNGPLSPF